MNDGPRIFSPPPPLLCPSTRKSMVGSSAPGRDHVPYRCRGGRERGIRHGRGSSPACYARSRSLGNMRGGSTRDVLALPAHLSARLPANRNPRAATRCLSFMRSNTGSSIGTQGRDGVWQGTKAAGRCVGGERTSGPERVDPAQSRQKNSPRAGSPSAVPSPFQKAIVLPLRCGVPCCPQSLSLPPRVSGRRGRHRTGRG